MMSNEDLNYAPTEPEVVGNLRVTNATTSSVSLTWTEPAGNRSVYRVQWADGHSNGTSRNVSGTNITINNLTAGVLYYISVAAVADDGHTEGRNVTVERYTSK